MCFLNQMLKGLFISETGINLRIVRCIIFVIGRRLVDGGQINSVDSQLLEIIQFLCNTSQISSKAFLIGNASMIAPRQHIFRIIGGIPIAEPVRKYLIPDRIIHPCRCLWHIAGIHPRKNKALPAPSL